MRRSAAVCLMLLLAAAGCRKRFTGPDANYQKASRIYQQLYAAQLDDAYGDPKIDEVVGLLKQVDPNSVDAEAAQTMLGAIQHGKEQLAAQRIERDKAAAAAQTQAGAPVINIDPAQVIAASTPDAGEVKPDPYGAGATVADINAASGGCLIENEPFTEQRTNVAGAVYRVVPGAACAQKLPGFVGQAVLVVDGKIYRRIEDPNPPKPPAPPAPPAAPDAGAPPAAAATPAAPPAPKPAAQADAGEPEYQIVVPGQPEPGVGAPPAPPAGEQQ